jgi:hypothetical protein
MSKAVRVFLALTADRNRILEEPGLQSTTALVSLEATTERPEKTRSK